MSETCGIGKALANTIQMLPISGKQAHTHEQGSWMELKFSSDHGLDQYAVVHVRNFQNPGKHN